jgi:hypothetical protein
MPCFLSWTKQEEIEVLLKWQHFRRREGNPAAGAAQMWDFDCEHTFSRSLDMARYTLLFPLLVDKLGGHQ